MFRDIIICVRQTQSTLSADDEEKPVQSTSESLLYLTTNFQKEEVAEKDNCESRLIKEAEPNKPTEHQKVAETRSTELNLIYVFYEV